MENEEKLAFEKNGWRANKKSSFPEETRFIFGLIGLVSLFLVGTLIAGIIWGFPVAL
jgi:hypothetical protein